MALHPSGANFVLLAAGVRWPPAAEGQPQGSCGDPRALLRLAPLQLLTRQLDLRCLHAVCPCCKCLCDCFKRAVTRPCKRRGSEHTSAGVCSYLQGCTCPVRPCSCHSSSWEALCRHAVALVLAHAIWAACAGSPQDWPVLAEMQRLAWEVYSLRLPPLAPILPSAGALLGQLGHISC